MSIECTPGNLIEQSKCILGCSDEGQRQAMMVWLLAQVAKVNSDPGYLLDQSRCLLCLNEGQLKAAMTYLLCQISNAECYPCQPFSPCPPCPPCPDLPDIAINQDVVAPKSYDASLEAITGTITSIDLNTITTYAAGDTLRFDSLSCVSISLPLLSTSGTLTFTNLTLCNSINVPLLSAVGADLTLDTTGALAGISFTSLVTVAGTVLVQNNNVLLSFIAPLLTTIGVDLTFGLGNPVLSSLSLNSLVSIAGNFTASQNPIVNLNLPSFTTCGNIDFSSGVALTTVSFPLFLPTNGTSLNFANNAMDQTSVDHVLARCVANPAYVTGNVDLSGGTNSTPSAAGLLDVATLIGRGVAVATN